MWIYIIVRRPLYFGAKKQDLMSFETLEAAIDKLDDLFCNYCFADEEKISELEFESRGISYFIEIRRK